MELATALAHVKKAAASPGGRAAIRAVATAGGVAGRLGHPVVGAVVVLSANYLTQLVGAEATEEDPR